MKIKLFFKKYYKKILGVLAVLLLLLVITFNLGVNYAKIKQKEENTQQNINIKKRVDVVNNNEYFTYGYSSYLSGSSLNYSSFDFLPNPTVITNYLLSIYNYSSSHSKLINTLDDGSQFWLHSASSGRAFAISIYIDKLDCNFLLGGFGVAANYLTVLPISNYITYISSFPFEWVSSTNEYCLLLDNELDFYLKGDTYSNYDFEFAPLFRNYLNSNNVIMISSDENGSYQLGFNNGVNFVVNSPNDYDLYSNDDLISYGNVKYNEGADSTLYRKGFFDFFNVILNSPYTFFHSFLNFEFLGINLFNLLSFVVSISLVFFIVKLFRK